MTLSSMKKSANERPRHLKNLSIGCREKLSNNEVKCDRVDQLYALS